MFLRVWVTSHTWILDLGFWILNFGSLILNFHILTLTSTSEFHGRRRTFLMNMVVYGRSIRQFFLPKNNNNNSFTCFWEFGLHHILGSWIFYFGFWILDFGFWILDFGFWMPNFELPYFDFNINKWVSC